MKEIINRLFFLPTIFIASLFSIHAMEEEKSKIDEEHNIVESPFSSSIHGSERVQRIEDMNYSHTTMTPTYLADSSLRNDRENYLSFSSIRNQIPTLPSIMNTQRDYYNPLQIDSDLLSRASSMLSTQTDYYNQFQTDRGLLSTSISTPNLVYTLMAGGPPPGPLENLLKYHIDLRESFERNFIRGNIQSFLGVMNDFRHIYFPSLYDLHDSRPYYNWYRNFNLEQYWEHHRLLLRPLQLFDLDGALIEINPGGALQQGQNLENVMDGERIRKTKQAIEHIYGLLKGKDTSEELCIQELQQHLEYLLKSEHYSKYFRPSNNGMNEIDNARLTLQGPAAGFPAILEEMVYITLDNDTPVTIKSLLAKSWWLITRQIKDKEQSIVKETLVKSLGQCIEDDGHRVCDVGKSQRITTALQGYIEGIKIDNFDTPPTPQTFLSAFFTPKQKEIEIVMSQTPEEQRLYAVSLFNEAMQQAQQLYNNSSREINEITRMMKDFIKCTLDFEGDL